MVNQFSFVCNSAEHHVIHAIYQMKFNFQEFIQRLVNTLNTGNKSIESRALVLLYIVVTICLLIGYKPTVHSGNNH